MRHDMINDSSVQKFSEKRARRKLAATTALLLLSCNLLPLTTAPVLANDWTGANSPDWFDPANWADGSVPVPGEDAKISGLPPFSYPVIEAGSTQIRNLFVGAAGRMGTLSVENGGQLEVTGDKFEVAGDAAMLTVTGAGSILTAENAELLLGDYRIPGSSGSLQVLDGGQATLKRLYTDDDASRVLVSGQGSILTLNEVLSAGTNGNNEGMTVSEGGTVIVHGSADVGGATEITGSGSRLVVDSENGRRGSLTITSFDNAASPSVVRVVDGGAIAVSTQSQTLDASIRIAATHGVDTAELLVDGAGSTVTANNRIIVGDGGDGILTVSRGGTVTTADELQIGQLDDAIGTLNIGAAEGDAPVAVGTVTAKQIVVAKGSQINFNHDSDNFEFSQLITGEGNLNQRAGTTILLADNSLSGTATISGGVLRLGNGGETGTLQASIVNNATLVFDHSNHLTYAQQISGTGQLLQYGTGMLTLTGDNSYLGGTVIRNTILQLGDGGTTGSIMGDVDNDGMLFLNRSNTLQLDGTISGTGGLVQQGSGTSVLTADNSYSGGTRIDAGALQLGNGGNTGSVLGPIENNGSLIFDRSDTALRMDGVIAGNGRLVQQGTGTTTLTAENSFSGGTEISRGTLQIGNGGNTGSITGNVTNNGTLVFDRAGTVVLSGAMDGSGTLIQAGEGGLVLSGDSSSFVGETNVNSGTLLVNGVLGGAVHVGGGASLGGQGSILGNTDLNDGASLVGREGYSLSFDHNLRLGAQNNINVYLGAPTTDGLFHVKGDLTLAGTVNVYNLGNFGPGLYRLFDYDGQLDDQGVTLGDVPGGDRSQMHIQTAVDHQVNLINSAGMTLNFWDGARPGDKNNGHVDGGDGVWDAVAENWTDADGALNNRWDANQFAVFSGAPGTVTVDKSKGDVVAAGLQFATDGYQIEGDALTLVGSAGAAPIIRVGADARATIANPLNGSEGIDKTDFGTLILTADNTYTGGTNVREGTLQLGNGGTTGSVKGDITLSKTDYDKGTLALDRSDDVVLENRISGAGEVRKLGAGTTTFSGDNSFSGGLSVESGTAKAGIERSAFGSGRLAIAAGAKVELNNFDITTGGLLGEGDVALGSGSLTLDQSFDSRFAGVISGSGGVTKTGTGSLELSGRNDYSGPTIVDGGTVQQVSQDSLSSSSDYRIGDSGRIDLGGFDTSMASLSNAGTIDFASQGGTKLTVNGNYSSQNGTLLLNAVLAGDDSVTDQLKVTGDTSGNTNLKMVNHGGSGDQTVNGIKVVSVEGQSGASFNLQGDYTTRQGEQAVVAGAYAYTLHQGGVETPNDGDWYLRSDKLVNPGVPVYQAYIGNLRTLNRLSSYHDRTGNRDFSDDSAQPVTAAQATPQYIWARVEGAYDRLQPKTTSGAINQNINRYAMQAGIDGVFSDTESGRVFAGIAAQYGQAHSAIASQSGDGKIDTAAWSLRSTMTWSGNNGLYVDGQAQMSWFDSDLHSDTANEDLVKALHARGYALSVESGRKIALNDRWSLTPQAQLQWSALGGDSFNDVFNADIALRHTDSLMARLGLAVNYSSGWLKDDGRAARTDLYGVANLYQEFLGGTAIRVSGVDFDTDDDRTWAGIGAGGSYSWADDRYAIYGLVSVNTGLQHFGDSFSVAANIGYRQYF
ncbi:hypothetical protein Brsp05_04482 [Brucella sp. NBRC 12953]|uniref:autotransporter outer membrane beta-barrel domain-containing protein n=1 Tax=Brucella sp. NBRC 12953 TaxID=3075481 RepID=UPI0030AA4450